VTAGRRRAAFEAPSLLPEPPASRQVAARRSRVCATLGNRPEHLYRWCNLAVSRERLFISAWASSMRPRCATMSAKEPTNWPGGPLNSAANSALCARNCSAGLQWRRNTIQFQSVARRSGGSVAIETDPPIAPVLIAQRTFADRFDQIENHPTRGARVRRLSISLPIHPRRWGAGCEWIGRQLHNKWLARKVPDGGSHTVARSAVAVRRLNAESQGDASGRVRLLNKTR
jgi:hypothetical protein